MADLKEAEARILQQFLEDPNGRIALKVFFLEQAKHFETKSHAHMQNYNMPGAQEAAFFNGDTGANYWFRYLTAAQGTATIVNLETTAATAISLGVVANKGRQIILQAGNALAKTKVCSVANQFGSGVTGTASTATISGQGEWINTTAQITSILLTTAGGTSMTVGSSYALIGYSAP